MRWADFIYSIGYIWSRMPRMFPFEKIRQLFISGYYGAKFASCGERFRLSFPIKFIHGAQHIHIGNDVYIHPDVRLERE